MELYIWLMLLSLLESKKANKFNYSDKELDGILEYEELKNVPIVILGNKIDKKGSMLENELRD